MSTLSELTGVGPKACEAYASLGVHSIEELIEFVPRDYEDRSTRICIGNQMIGGPWTNTIVQVVSKSSFGKGLKNIKIIVEDTQNGVKAELLGFNRSFLDHIVFPGSFYSLYANRLPDDGWGKVKFSQFELKHVAEDVAFAGSVNGGILPVYPLAGKLTQNIVRRDIANALSRIKKIENDLPQYLYDKYHLISKDSAIRKIHFPQCEADISEARQTLAFTEVFYLQLFAMRKPGNFVRRAVDKTVYQIESEFIASLPFSLTGDQLKALDEIRTDMSKEQSMNRLLQGDVGCGKTLVAWISALHAIAEGVQVAFMAPTELLARQHAQNAATIFKLSGISIAYLDGEVHGKARQLVLKELAAGNIDLIIGTHALFSKDVEFANLGYVIVDEQHRFGVEQRRALFEKGQSPDVLLMTATPIPRTLALTIYGNLNVSTIKTMPEGRTPVKTFLVDANHREEMYRSVGVELERGHKAYFVYPRIESEEEDGLRDVTTMFDFLSSKYPGFKGALIHSKLSDDVKVDTLNRFSSGDIQFLVSTSVVEVGIDVPDATCMVIEHADFFGLSALHQLRGRVGRSTLRSWCFLVFEPGISEDGKRRLGVLRRTNDGFEIAEEDLKIRGPGEITGLRQSGFNNLKYASLDKDLHMMAAARDEVSAILERDPGLISLENAPLRILKRP